MLDDWVVGLILVLLGCCCSAVGLVLLKHSTNVEEHLPLHKRPFWLTGVVFLIVNASVIDVIAFSLAPLTLVAPFSGVTMLLTTWLASSGVLFVKETVDIWDTISTAIALVGVVMTTYFGPHVDEAKGANELSDCFRKVDVHVFAAVSGGLLGCAWLSYFGNVQLRAQTWFRICLFAYTAAIAGSASMLLLKVVGTGMRGYVESSYAAANITGLFIGSLLGLICCAIVQLGFLHRTLANSPVSYGVPTYQTLLTIITIIAGGIFFDEFSVMPPKDFVWFSFGVFISLCGVGMHTLHRSSVEIETKGPPVVLSSPAVMVNAPLQQVNEPVPRDTALSPAHGHGERTHLIPR